MFSITRTIFLVLAIFLLSRNIALYINSGKTEDTFGEIIKHTRNVDSKDVIITNYIIGLLFIMLGNFVNNLNIKFGLTYGGMLTLAYTTYFNWGCIDFKYRLLILISFIISAIYKDIMEISGIKIPFLRENYNNDTLLNKIISTAVNVISNAKQT
jgi:hypothetical protein